jgi:hypothetical protein
MMKATDIPNNPSYTWIHKAVLVTGNVDADYLGKTKVPDEIWHDERSNKTTRGSIN